MTKNIYLISNFTVTMRAGMKKEFSPRERMFVCYHIWHERSFHSFAVLLPNVLVREHIFQLVLHGGPGGGQHAKPQH